MKRGEMEMVNKQKGCSGGIQPFGWQILWRGSGGRMGMHLGPSFSLVL